MDAEISSTMPKLSNNNNVGGERNNLDDNESSSPSLGRFNRKYLPSWAKKQIEDGSEQRGDSQQSPYLPLPSAFLPKGRWAQRMSESPVKPAWERELPQRLNIEIKPRLDVSRNEDELRSVGKRCLVNSSSASSSLPQEDDDITTTDSDACYPQSGYKVPSDIKAIKPGVKPKPKVVRRGKLLQNAKLVPSVSVPNINDLRLEDEEADVVKPQVNKAKPKFTRNPLYVSTENLERLDRSENVSSRSSPRAGNTTAKSAESREQTNNLNLSSAQKKSSTSTVKMPSAMVSKPPISKRREELTKAISEARKKLETIGWKGTGLNSSKSIANLRDINDTGGNLSNYFGGSEAVRRSISLSDLSVSNRRILPPTKADTDESAPLWKLRDVDRVRRNSQEATPLRSGSTTSLSRTELLSQIKTMPRFRSQGLWGTPVSVRNSGRLSAPPQRHYNKKSSNCINGNEDGSGDNSSSSSDTGVRTLRPGTPPKPNIFRQIRRSSTSQVVGPKPPNSSQQKTCRKLWDNFALRSAKSDYNLNFVGRDSQQSRIGSFNVPSWDAPEMLFDEKFDLSNTNPATIPLTRELCHHIIDELNQIATYTKKIYHRSAAEGNTGLCNILVDGISKAYVNLSTVVNPSTVSNGTMSPNVNCSEQGVQPDNAAYTMKLLQQYSDKLLNLVEQRMTKEKHNQNS